jgi:hypothetical protein
VFKWLKTLWKTGTYRHGKVEPLKGYKDYYGDEIDFLILTEMSGNFTKYICKDSKILL